MNAASYVSEALWARGRTGSRGALVEQFSLRSNQLGALLLLLLSSPLMLLVAWLTWRRDGVPVFFAHYRVGRDGRLFRCLKFRTMFREAEQMLANLLHDDPVALAEWNKDQKLRN